MAQNLPTRVYIAGDVVKFALYEYKNLTAGDTFVLSADFTNIQYATMVNTAGVTQAPAISANTTLTVGAGPNKDDGYLLVVGTSS